jgi:hypothetical protein
VDAQDTVVVNPPDSITDGIAVRIAPPPPPDNNKQPSAKQTGDEKS